MEALILYAKDEKMIRFLGKLFTSLCQSVSLTIQASVCVIPSVSSVSLSILSHDSYCKFNKILMSKGRLGMRQKS
jgi:hypothetical protein